MTGAQEPTSVAAPRGARPATAGDSNRGGPKAIQLLVPVWGTPFISQFLRVSLPTLLAPGNLPALAKSLPCKLVFLTSSDDAADLRDHAAVHFLRSVCDVEIRIIDDLITGDNYSTTITLAYARAVRAAGDAMLDTCFFFMISDYIMADGSLANVLAKMKAGYSGVVAGNFQVVEESAQESFFKTFDFGRPQMVVRSRKLMRWALDHLHPMTLANMVNFPLSHSVHSNRLFWRVDENTLIGRFYLMHMVCIRPELTDFVVGSSCDYSFIPEMCPSGKVYAMTDSDDYLVVEMQKRGHERNFVRLGAVNQPVLTESLAEWATGDPSQKCPFCGRLPCRQICRRSWTRSSQSSAPTSTRSNVRYPNLRRIVIIPTGWGRWPPMNGPSRNGRTLLGPTATDMLQSRATGFNWWLYRSATLSSGVPPFVRSWHPRWPDYRMFMDLAQRYFSGNDRVIADYFQRAGRIWQLPERCIAIGRFARSGQIPHAQSRAIEPLMGSYEGCLLVLGDAHINRARDLIRRIKPLFSGERPFWYSPSMVKAPNRTVVQRRHASRRRPVFRS